MEQIEGRMFNRRAEVKLGAWEARQSKNHREWIEKHNHEKLQHFVRQEGCTNCTRCPSLKTEHAYEMVDDSIRSKVRCGQKNVRMMHDGKVLNVLKCPDQTFDLATGKPVPAETPSEWEDTTFMPLEPTSIEAFEREYMTRPAEKYMASTPSAEKAIYDEMANLDERKWRKMVADHVDHETLEKAERYAPVVPAPKRDQPKTVEADVW